MQIATTNAISHNHLNANCVCTHQKIFTIVQTALAKLNERPVPAKRSKNCFAANNGTNYCHSTLKYFGDNF